MFVIHDRQESGVSHCGIIPNGVENPVDQELPLLHVVIRVLIARREKCIGGIVFGVGITRLDETVDRKAILAAVREKVVDLIEVPSLVHEPFEGHGHG